MYWREGLTLALGLALALAEPGGVVPLAVAPVALLAAPVALLAAPVALLGALKDAFGGEREVALGSVRFPQRNAPQRRRRSQDGRSITLGSNPNNP